MTTATIYDLASFRAAIQDKQLAPGFIASASQSTGSLTPTQQWLLAHPRFATDPAHNSTAMFGHYHALRCGLTADTPEYFDHVEYFTGDRELPLGCCRPCEKIEFAGQPWLVWDVTRDLQPIIVRNGRKMRLVPGTWTRLAEAVKKVLANIGEEQA